MSFAHMTREKHLAVAARGGSAPHRIRFVFTRETAAEAGRKSQASGRGHRWEQDDEAPKIAGRLGGLAAAKARRMP